MQACTFAAVWNVGSRSIPAGWLAGCSSSVLDRWLPGCMLGRYSDVAGVSLSD